MTTASIVESAVVSSPYSLAKPQFDNANSSAEDCQTLIPPHSHVYRVFSRPGTPRLDDCASDFAYSIYEVSSQLGNFSQENLSSTTDVSHLLARQTCADLHQEEAKFADINGSHSAETLCDSSRSSVESARQLQQQRASQHFIDSSFEAEEGTLANSTSSMAWYDYNNDKHYNSVYEEVLQSLECMDQVSEVPEITTPQSYSDSIFSNDITHSSPLSMGSPEFTDHELQADLTQKPLVKHHVHHGSLLKTISRTFSTTSLSSIASNSSKKSSPTKEHRQSLLGNASHSLRRRFSFISFAETPELPRQHQFAPTPAATPAATPRSPQAARYPKASNPYLHKARSMAEIANAATRGTTSYTQKRRIGPMRSVSNLGLVREKAAPVPEFGDAADTTPVPRRTRPGATMRLPLLKSIEDTICLNGAEEDPDYAEFKAKYLQDTHCSH